MSEPFIGEICLFPYTYAPSGWAFCEGQIMQIAQNQALYSLLGTYYGGNGTTTFALPDLRGRVPVGCGQGPNLSNYSLAQQGGNENVTLTSNQIPPHSHLVAANTGDATDSSPANGVPAAGGAYAKSSNATMNPTMIQGSGGSNQPHENRAPFLALHYCIALTGLYPTRD